MQVSGTSTKHTVICLFVNVIKIHKICYFYLLVLVSICALLNACSVISYNWYGPYVLCFNAYTDYKKRYQQQHEQENVVRRGLIIHQSPLACWAKPPAQHKTQWTKKTPQRAQANHRTTTPPTPKRANAHWNQSHQPKARQTMSEH